jgi:hypothetical protein
LAWIDRSDDGYVAAIVGDVEAEPITKSFRSAALAYNWVSAEAEARGVPIKWRDRTPPEPPALAC